MTDVDKPSPFQERLQWVIANRADGNASKLSEDAGLARGHLGQLAREKKPRDVALSVILKIARAAKVSPSWLAFGTGSRDGSPKEPGEPEMPPELADAVFIGRRWSAWTVETVASLARSKGLQRTAAEWSVILDKFEATHAQIVGDDAPTTSSMARIRT
jgi:hypothetical protein